MAHEEKMKVQAGTHTQDLGSETFCPLVDVYETPDGTTVVTVEMPGAPGSTLDIRVEKGVLSVYGDARTDPPENQPARMYAGFERGQYFRAFAISDEVDRDNIRATYSEGVLTLTLPRAAAAQTRKIEISEG